MNYGFTYNLPLQKMSNFVYINIHVANCNKEIELITFLAHAVRGSKLEVNVFFYCTQIRGISVFYCESGRQTDKRPYSKRANCYHYRKTKPEMLH